MFNFFDVIPGFTRNPVDPSFRWDDKSRLDSRLRGNDRVIFIVEETDLTSYLRQAFLL